MKVNGTNAQVGDVVQVGPDSPRERWYVLKKQRAELDERIADCVADARDAVDAELEIHRARIRAAEDAIERLLDTRKAYEGGGS